MNLTVIDQDTGHEMWTSTQCAEHCGISRSTWLAYSSRGQCPSSVGRYERTVLWDSEDVRRWHSARTGAVTPR